MVTKLRLLLKLYNTGVPQRKISTQLELSRTSVKAYLDRFIASDKKAEELTQLDDAIYYLYLSECKFNCVSG